VHGRVSGQPRLSLRAEFKQQYSEVFGLLDDTPEDEKSEYLKINQKFG